MTLQGLERLYGIGQRSFDVFVRDPKALMTYAKERYQMEALCL